MCQLPLWAQCGSLPICTGDTQQCLKGSWFLNPLSSNGCRILHHPVNMMTGACWVQCASACTRVLAGYEGHACSAPHQHTAEGTPWVLVAPHVLTECECKQAQGGSLSRSSYASAYMARHDAPACLQVGKDQRAQAFLATLDNDPTIGSNVDCTSYYVSLLLRAMHGTVLTSLQQCRAAQATE